MRTNNIYKLNIKETLQYNELKLQICLYLLKFYQNMFTVLASHLQYLLLQF